MYTFVLHDFLIIFINLFAHLHVCSCMQVHPCHVAHGGSENNFQESILTFQLFKARSPISTALLFILSRLALELSNSSPVFSPHFLKESWDHRCMPPSQTYYMGFRDQARDHQACTASTFNCRAISLVHTILFLCLLQVLMSLLGFLYGKVLTFLFIHNGIIIHTCTYWLIILYSQGKALNKSFEI